MRLLNLGTNEFAQLELNNVAFRRDGRIEAQCKPAGALASGYIENGMLLAIDNVSRTVTFADPSDANQVIGLNYTSEHMYDERKDGLKDFALKGTDDFLPRLGLLAVGDKFTTNCVSYESALATDDAAFKAAVSSIASTPLYGGISAEGAIAVSAAMPTVGPVLKVVAGTTMPNNSYGLKFQVIKD